MSDFAIPLKKWSLRNFKSVADGEVSFAPLTVLVGSNSSGKSSLIQSILLFAQASRSWRQDGTIPLNGPLVGLGEFESTLHTNASSKEIAVRAEFSLDSSSRGQRGSMGAPERHGRFGIRLGGDVTWEVVLADASPAGHSGSASLKSLSIQQADSFYLRAKHTSPNTRSPLAPPGEAPFVSVAGVVGETDLEQSVSWIAHKAGLPTQIYVSALSSAVDADRWHRRLAEHVIDRRLGKSGAPEEHVTPRQLERFVRGREGGSFGVGRELLFRHYLWDLELEQLDVEQLELAGAAAPSREDAAQELPFKDDELNALEGDFTAFRTRRQGRPSMRDPETRASTGVSAVDLDRLEEVLLSPSLSLHLLSYLVRGTRDSRRQPIPLRGFAPSDQTLSAADGILSLLRTEIAYLGPLREEPQAMYRISQTEQADDVGSKGEHTASVLYRLAKKAILSAPMPEGVKGSRTLGHAVNQWLEFFGMASFVTTEDRGKLGLELQIGVDDVEPTLDITAVGVGLSQVLPVIVRVLLARPGSVVLLEQPELHLHPALQQRLGDFLIRAAESGRQVIVETHSDHLISQLRLRVASDSGQETRSLVQLVNVWRENGRTRYEPVNIDRYGGLEGWPPGFLDQGPEVARQILEAGLEKRLRDQ